VLVPDTGGAGSLVRPDATGFRFRANDADDLAASLMRVAALSPAALDSVAAAARAELDGRFSERARLAQYRALLEEAA